MVKVKPVHLGKNVRMSFNRINEVLEMPNLIEVQKNSYQWFLDQGLKEVFQDVSAITDYTGNLVLDFIDYHLDETPKYTVEECKERDVTYAAPLRVRASLLNKETGEVKEQEIFMGDFPLMTESGTFVINGAERVIVSQLVRSPGVYYGMSYDKTGKKLFTSTVIPNRGAWLEYETDANDIFYVRIDKNRKIPITTFIRALLKMQDDKATMTGDGLTDQYGTDQEIYEIFGEDERLVKTIQDKDNTKNGEEGLLEVYRKLRPGEPPTVDSAVTHLQNLFFDSRRYDLSRVGRYKYNKKLGIAFRIAGKTIAEPVANPMTGELMANIGDVLTIDQALEVERAGVSKVKLSVEDKEFYVISNGMVDIKDFVDFDCSEYGINEKVRFVVLKEILEQNESEEALREAIKANVDSLIPKHIIKDDIFASINYINNLCYGVGNTDDIDHLGNRRIRSVGELLQNQFRIGFSRMERVIRERMTIQAQDTDVITPQALVNIRPVVAAIKEFFGSSPLSQFMDQTNPLAGLTHLRELTFGGAVHMESLDIFSEMTELQELVLHATNTNYCSAADLSALSHMTKLQRLSIEVDGLTSLAGLEPLHELLEIELYSRGSSCATLQPLAGLENLQSVTIHLIGTRSLDISALGNLPNLQWVDIGPSRAISDASSVDHVPNVNFSN